MSNYSPDPGVPQTPTKALVAGLIGGLLAFGAYYVGDDGAFTRKEIVQALLLAVPASGLIGVPTYITKNSRKR